MSPVPRQRLACRARTSSDCAVIERLATDTLMHLNTFARPAPAAAVLPPRAVFDQRQATATADSTPAAFPTVQVMRPP